MLAKEMEEWSKSSCRQQAANGRGRGRILVQTTKPGSRWLPLCRVSRWPQETPLMRKAVMASVKPPAHPASGASPVLMPVPRVPPQPLGPSALQLEATRPNQT